MGGGMGGRPGPWDWGTESVLPASPDPPGGGRWGPKWHLGRCCHNSHPVLGLHSSSDLTAADIPSRSPSPSWESSRGVYTPAGLGPWGTHMADALLSNPNNPFGSRPVARVHLGQLHQKGKDFFFSPKIPETAWPRHAKALGDDEADTKVKGGHDHCKEPSAGYSPRAGTPRGLERRGCGPSHHASPMGGWGPQDGLPSLAAACPGLAPPFPTGLCPAPWISASPALSLSEATARARRHSAVPLPLSQQGIVRRFLTFLGTVLWDLWLRCLGQLKAWGTGKRTPGRGTAKLQRIRLGKSLVARSTSGSRHRRQQGRCPQVPRPGSGVRLWRGPWGHGPVSLSPTRPCSCHEDKPCWGTPAVPAGAWRPHHAPPCCVLQEPHPTAVCSPVS